MIDTVRSFFITIYKAKAVVAVCFVIVAILLLSAYVGSNTFFNQDKDIAVTATTTEQELYNRKSVAPSSVNNHTTTPHDSSDQSEPPTPANTSTVKIEDKPKKVSCDEVVKNSFIQERRTKTESENSLHAANILSLQKTTSSVLSTVSSELNDLLRAEDQRHADALTVIENDYLAKLPGINCTL